MIARNTSHACDPRQVAIQALECGLSVCPPREDGTKAPEGKQWKQWQTRRATLDQIHAWYGTKGPSKRTGLGAIMGAVSGNTECFEFDARGITYGPLIERADAIGLGELVDRIRVGYEERTPSEGIHWLYQCETVGPNTKLAQYLSDEVNEKTGEPIIKPLIETRGEGGFIILAPSNGDVHPSKGAYELIRGGLDSIATITPEERADLFALARTFDEVSEPERVHPDEAKAVRPMKGGPPDAVSPGDDYNARADWHDILAGWEFVYEHGDTQYLRRPGKKQGVSATIRKSTGRLFVFSTSTEFEAEKAYSKFAAFTRLHHGNNFSAAAKALSRDGYGTPALKAKSSPAKPSSNGDGQPHPDGPDAKPEPPKPPEFEAAPKPLKSELLEVIPLPPELIPEPLRPWLEDIATRGSFAIETPAAAVMVALSCLLGRNLMIRPKRHDAWTVIPNIWGGVVGHPGIQKSPPVKEALSPLRRLVAEAIEEHAEATKRALEDVAIAEALAAAAKKKLTKAANDGASREDLRSIVAEAEAAGFATVPTCKRYEANDATVEKLGELLRENPRGLLQFRDELTGFLKAMERQGHEADRAFYLETWSGDGHCTIDRIGRGTIHVKALCLSIFGTIQPGPLAKYLKGTVSGDEADGFMPRFQMLVYPDAPEKFVNVDRWPDKDAKDKAFNIFQWIDRLTPATMGAEHDEDNDTYFLRFSGAAQEVFDGWRNDLENRLRSGTETAMMAGHLAKYRSLMPSLALILHVVDSYGSSLLDPVSREAAEKAAAWCDFLELHARRIYQAASEGDPEVAARLGERIKQSLPNPFTFRQVANKGWSGLDNVEDVRRAVGILEDRGWAKVVVKPPGKSGGRPSEEVWINPVVQESGIPVS